MYTNDCCECWLELVVVLWPLRILCAFKNIWWDDTKDVYVWLCCYWFSGSPIFVVEDHDDNIIGYFLLAIIAQMDHFIRGLVIREWVHSTPCQCVSWGGALWAKMLSLWWGELQFLNEVEHVVRTNKVVWIWRCS